MRHWLIILALHGFALCAVAPGVVLAQTDPDCVGFAERPVVEGGTNGVERVLVADIDDDGDLDLATTSFGDGKLYWYDNAGDAAMTPEDRFTPRLITADLGSAADLFVADLDGDGDLDLMASSRDGFIRWFEQAGGTATPVFTPRTVTNRPLIPLGLHAADVDGDGFVDIQSASFLDNTIAWYRNSGGVPPVFTRNVITESAMGAAAVWAGQVDGDAEGRTDVLAASRIDGEVALYRQLEPEGEDVATFEKILIAGVESRCETTSDIVCLVDTDCPLVPPEDEVHESCVPLPLPTAFGATSIDAADLDGDGHVDVVVAALDEDKIVWFKNDGQDPPGFTAEQPGAEVTTDAVLVRSVRIARVDDDPYPDLIAASYGDDTVAWYRNDGSGNFQENVVATDVTSADDVGAGDLDGDDLVDLVSVSSVSGFPAMLDRIAWFQAGGTAANPAYPDTVDDSVRISRSADGALKAVLGDLDNDGDLDAAAVGRTDRVTWYRSDSIGAPTSRQPGEAPTFEERLISSDAAQPVDVVAVDLDPADGDPDLDVITASFDDGTIRWFENDLDGTTGVPVFAERTPFVASGLDNLQALVAADLDGDGLIDLVSAERGVVPEEPEEGEDPTPYGRIQWYARDPSADSGFSDPYVITDDAPGVQAIHVADVDNDGDLDVLAAIFDDGVFAWYESVREQMPGVEDAALFNDERMVIDEDLIGPSAIWGADVDGDGDTDVVAGAALTEVVVWYDSNGMPPPDLAFERQFIVSDADDVTQVFTEDVNGDGMTDIVAAVPGDDLLVWFRNDGREEDDMGNPGPVGFTTDIFANPTDLAFTVAAGNVDRDVDGKIDFVSGQRLDIRWYQQSGEICGGFDVNGDDEINGVELAWIGRAFGLESADPGTEWWGPVDYNGDGTVDGEDLAILASDGVFGLSTTTCRFTCD